MTTEISIVVNYQSKIVLRQMNGRHTHRIYMDRKEALLIASKLMEAAKKLSLEEFHQHAKR